MSRDVKIFLEDILVNIEKIEGFITGLNKVEFAEDEKTHETVVRKLEIIGEAVKQIPEQVRLLAPDVEWKKIAGARDIFIHAYWSVNIGRVWNMINEELPVLKTAIKNILGELENEK